ncbi:hypothetical protein [Clostridium kluyveri]|nr:hypothetical protein [Clostridium kluyveri]
MSDEVISIVKQAFKDKVLKVIKIRKTDAADLSFLNLIDALVLKTKILYL